MSGRLRAGWLSVLLLLQTNFVRADVTRHEIDVDGKTRTFVVYAPPQYDGETPWPVVFAFHGAFEDGEEMQGVSGLNNKADEAGFLIVYPDAEWGFGVDRFWNTGSWKIFVESDNGYEVRFVEKLLDEVPELYAVDQQRVYATGFSLGGMLCHQLAAEFPDRIAAIATVEGPIAVPIEASRSVPVMSFHGTEDWVIPFEGPVNFIAWLILGFTSTDDTLAYWREINGCPPDPVITEYPDIEDDGTTVERWEYEPGAEGAEVVLIKIYGGGHTWPGRYPGTWLYGRSTEDIHANDLMWEFFEKYTLPAP